MTLNFSSRRVITLILLKQLSFIIFYLKFVPLDANYFFTKFLNSIKREDFAYSINVRPIRNAKLPTQNIILVAQPVVSTLHPRSIHHSSSPQRSDLGARLDLRTPATDRYSPWRVSKYPWVSAFASTRERVGLRNENEAMGRKVTAQKDWPLHPLHLLLLPSTERNEIAATCATIKCYRVGGRGLFPFEEDRIVRGQRYTLRSMRFREEDSGRDWRNIIYAKRQVEDRPE